MSKKQKKKKVKYIDDGRSLADMSRVGGNYSASGQRTGKPSDWLKTYFTAVKMMVRPMLVTLCIITIAFLVMWLLLQISLN